MADPASRALEVRGLTKRFPAAGGEVLAVDDVSFAVAAGEFFVMLGPSGCGKTTTLRMIAGLERPSAGAIAFAGRDFVTLPAREREIGMVFQSYALFPHLSAFENVAYGLRLRGLAEAEIRARVGETLALLRLADHAGRMPASLSGGQQQRVSIARALVYRPRLLLLDEPLANLDAKLRVALREEIRELQRRLGIASLYVTHDQEEAMALADRVGVFDRGRLVQVGAPAEIYREPRTPFVADFIGRANFLPAVAAADGALMLPWGETIAPRRVFVLDATPPGAPADAEALVMIRPELVALESGAGGVAARIQRVEFLGAVVRYAIAIDGLAVPLVADRARPLPDAREGSPVRVAIAGGDAIAYRRAAR